MKEMMLVYRDEKMYGPPVNGMTIEKLEEEIKKLEKKIYGDREVINKEGYGKTPMIFDVKSGKLVSWI